MITFVSLLPYEIKDHQPHIIPDLYIIPAAKLGSFATLLIKDAKDYVYHMDGKHIERHVPAREIAQSLYRSYMSSQIGVDDKTGPGLFFVDGLHTADGIKLKFPAEMKKAEEAQRRWFQQLVRIADDDWTKFHRHSTISQMMRDAATFLNLERAWLSGNTDEVITKCPFCYSNLLNPAATVCHVCTRDIKPALVGAK